MTEDEKTAATLILVVLIAVGGAAGILLSTKDLWMK